MESGTIFSNGERKDLLNENSISGETILQERRANKDMLHEILKYSVDRTPFKDYLMEIL